ncbi:hypothetical protein AB6C45_10240 [Vibrio splendidus]
MVTKSNDVEEAKSFGFSSIKEFRRARTLIGSLIVETRKSNKKKAYKLYKLLQEKPDLKPLCEHLIQMPNLDAYKTKTSAKEFAMFRGHNKMDSIRIVKSGGAPGLGKKS